MNEAKSQYNDGMGQYIDGFNLVRAASAGLLLAMGSAAATERVEAGFSSDGSAEALVLRVVDSARSGLDVAAYVFTSAKIAKAIERAAARGVSVRVALDAKVAGGKYSVATFFSNHGIPTRLDGAHAIHHHKFMVVDGKSVLTGSFNFTSSAAQKNAENAIVIWNDKDLAARYAAEFDLHWSHATPAKASLKEQP